MLRNLLLGVALLGMVMASPVHAELKVGDTVPAFELKGTDGKTYKMSEMKDKFVVIAWYPKALTGG